MGDKELNLGKYHCSKESLRTSGKVYPSLMVPVVKKSCSLKANIQTGNSFLLHTGSMILSNLCNLSLILIEMEFGS